MKYLKIENEKWKWNTLRSRGEIQTKKSWEFSRNETLAGYWATGRVHLSHLVYTWSHNDHWLHDHMMIIDHHVIMFTKCDKWALHLWTIVFELSSLITQIWVGSNRTVHKCIVYNCMNKTADVEVITLIFLFHTQQHFVITGHYFSFQLWEMLEETLAYKTCPPFPNLDASSAKPFGFMIMLEQSY